jgi:hypothetical protein
LLWVEGDELPDEVTADDAEVADAAERTLSPP